MQGMDLTMAVYSSFFPSTVITKAMFNFDEMGLSNFILQGPVRISVSDGLGFEINWSSDQKNNIQEIFSEISKFANITFSNLSDFDSTSTSSIASPVEVGRANVSDINIYLINFLDNTLGQSSLNQNYFNYIGSEGDIQIDSDGFGSDLSFADTTFSKQVLLHEIFHSLGLSHPHYPSPTSVTQDFSSLLNVGFQKFGFKINNANDLNKEYFTIMSYDTQGSTILENAFTPMILDVIALQRAYGEGFGTHGSGNDSITAGTVGYRTYFDTGGNDTVVGSLHSSGVYINLGQTIVGADHLVGIVMSSADSEETIVNGGSPSSLRWLYGEYENAIGSEGDDLIVGNLFNNDIYCAKGDDYIYAGDGIDTVFFNDNFVDCSFSLSGNGLVVQTMSEGRDVLFDVERVAFGSSGGTVYYSVASLTGDTTSPTVTSITYGSNDGKLALGEVVTFTITLSEAVNVTGTPTIALANGGTASYTGGTGTTALTFSYAAAAGQTTADLATAATNALTGTIKDIAGNAVVAAGFNNVNPAGTLAVDVTAPTVSTFAPTDGATAVAASANIVLTFSEAIARGTGTISLRSGSATGTTVESFDAATSNRLTLSGSTLTIDPTSNLSANTQYFVVFTSGNIKDAAGNAYAGISTYDFRTAVDTVAPTFTSAATSADGLKVILTYNEALNATTAAKTAFAVKVAGVAATVNSVAVNGSTVELTLATAIGQGQAVTVGYTAPLASAATSNAAVQDNAGNDAATLAATTSVTNISTVDKSAPTFTRAATSVDGLKVILTYKEALNATTAAKTAFAVKVAGVAATVSSVAVNGSTLELTLATAIGQGQAVTVGYTAPLASAATSNAAVQDSAGNDAATLAATTSVTNISTAALDKTAPTFTSAATSADGLKLILTYNEALHATTAAITAFAVKVGGAAATVNSVAVNGSTVELTLATAIGQGQAVTVGYTAPLASAATSNAAVQDSAGNDAAALVATTAVTNISTVDKASPTVLSFSPTDGLTGVMVGSNIVLTFSETISRGTGAITLRLGSATGTVVESFDAATSNRLTLSGSTLTINPTSDLAYGTTYFVVFTSGNIRDTAGNAYAGISTYDFVSDDFSDTTGSTGQVSVGGVASTGAIGTSGDTDVFKVTLTAGVTYTFDLKAASGSLNPYLSLFDPSVTQVAFNNDNGSSVNSQFTYTAAVGGTYYLLASDFGSAIGTYSLTAAVDKTAPTALTFSPTDGLNGVAVGSNIVLTFSEAIARGTGTITLRSGSATGTVVESFDAATSNRLTLSGSTLTIDPTNELASNTPYFVVFTSGNIKDIAGNAYAGLSTYDFRTANIINGTVNNDTLNGTTGVDTISGLAGNDIIAGGAGTDSMDGGEASDLYIVAASADHAAAEFADTGSSGTDEVRFTSTTASSTLKLYAGDSGIEKVVIGTGSAAAAVTTATTALNVDASLVLNGLSIAGNAGANVITGTGFADSIYGYAGNDTLNGGDGDDAISGGAGTNKLNGGAGFDAVDYRDSVAAVTVSLAITTAQTTGGGGIDTLSGFEGILGGSANDVLTGDGNANAIYGFNGNDTLNGGAGDDYLAGGLGDDDLNGGDGTDAISGGAGTNRLNGGAGFDFVDYRDSIAAVRVSLAITTAQTTGGGGTDTLSGFEGILGGSANDVLIGDGGNNAIYGYSGHDALVGGSGNDTLIGGEGDDDIFSDDGNDSLTGGSGADWFYFDTTPNAATNMDTITDFVSGTDKLQFSKAVFTGLSSAALGNLTTEAFWSGAGVSSAHDATDRFIYNTTTGALFYDADGNAAGSTAVQVALLGATTHPTLSFADIQIIG